MKNESNNIQLKEIAEKAGVSISTVSIVLNGHGDNVRISKKTQQKIRAIAKELNYVPNIHARRLRMEPNGIKPTYIVAVFWNLETMEEMIVDFLRCLHFKSLERDFNIEIVVQPYKPGNLYELKNKFDVNHFSGVIIAGASDKDVNFLKINDFSIPIIVLNRETGKYSNIKFNDYEAGRNSAELFCFNGHRKAGIIGFNRESLASRLRVMGFQDECEKNSLEIRDEWIIMDQRMNFEGGYEMAKKLLSLDDHPTAIFIMYDSLALGVAAYCNEHGISIPNELEILVYGYLKVFEYYSPTLSSIFITCEELADSVITILIMILRQEMNAPINININPHFTARKSCVVEHHS